MIREHNLGSLNRSIDRQLSWGPIRARTAEGDSLLTVGNGRITEIWHYFNRVVVTSIFEGDQADGYDFERTVTAQQGIGNLLLQRGVLTLSDGTVRWLHGEADEAHPAPEFSDAISLMRDLYTIRPHAPRTRHLRLPSRQKPLPSL